MRDLEIDYPLPEGYGRKITEHQSQLGVGWVPEENQVHGFLAEVVVLIQIALNDTPQVGNVKHFLVFLLVQFGGLQQNQNGVHMKNLLLGRIPIEMSQVFQNQKVKVC